MHNNIGDYMKIIIVIVRAFFSLLTLFLVSKMIGKKQVNELSLFDYVLGISIGNFAADMTLDLDGNFFHGVVAVFIFGLVGYFISIITMKSITLRRFFMGTPTVIIDNGELLESSLKKVKYDLNDLLEQCRSAGYFDLCDIKYAIVEANGQLSILPKNEGSKGLCANVIIDGKYMDNNISNSSITLEYLKDEIRKQNINLEEILLATCDEKRNICIYKKNSIEPKEVLE